MDKQRASRHAPPVDDDEDHFDTRLIWAGLFLSLAVFAKVPQVDVWFSQRYWTPGGGFFHARNPLVLAFYDYTPALGHALLALAALLAVAAPWLARHALRRSRPDWAQRLTGRWRRTAIGVVLVAVLSSGLAVELGLKNTIGRPRPVQTTEFGGQERFLPVFQVGQHPDRHRSFVSGHAAAGFTLISLGLFATPAWRRRWFLAGLVAGSAVGLGRIMQGGHYLSDVVFSFYVVWISCELVAFGMRRFDRRHRPTSPSPPRHSA